MAKSNTTTNDSYPGAVASALIPGLGQLYNGHLVKGILMMVFSAILWGVILLILAILTSGIPGIPGIIFAVLAIVIGVYTVLWAYSIHNAYRTT